MHLPGFIARRLVFQGKRSFSGFITRLSVIATALSVAAMIISLAIIYGFQSEISAKVFSFWGDIRVKAYEQDKATVAEETFIYKNDTVEKAIRSHPMVKGVNAYATKSALISNKKEFDGLMMKGVEKDFDWKAFERFIVQGRAIRFPDSGFSKEVLISAPVAASLKAQPGDKLFVYFMSEGEERARIKDVTIVGLYRTDIEEYDRQFFLGDLNLIRDLNFWAPNQIGGYEVFVKDFHQAETVSREINQSIPIIWQSRSIKQEYAHIFDWLGLLDTNKYLLLTIMGLVAAINLVTCLIVLILERIRMIGVLKSLGETTARIRQVFIYHTLFIGLTGTLIGAVAGFILCRVQQQTGFIRLPNAEAYSVATVPIQILWWHIPLVCAGTLLVCALVLSIPSLIIQRISPVKAVTFR
ncbi:MAG: ABC transporter permease [Dinghuibacter sp.]|nr:ABC transporter permease [Dinghuibacter sp.]